MAQAYPVKAYHFDEEKRKLVFIKAYIIDSCNYNCSYCYNKKPRTSKQLDLRKLLLFLEDVHKKTSKNIFLELIGGEPTLHPGLLEFCQTASKLKHVNTIYVYSNFSSDVSLYANLMRMCKIELNLSWHSTQHDKANRCFYRKAKELQNIIVHSPSYSKLVSFNIMLEHSNLSNALLMHNLICKLGLMSSIAYVGDLKNINSTNRYIYDKNEQQQIAQAMKMPLYDVTIEFSNGAQQNYNMNDLMRILDYGEISFYGWKCNAGIDRLYMHCDSNVYRCQQEFENGYQPMYSMLDGHQMVLPHACSCKVCLCEGFVNKSIMEDVQ